MAYRVFLLVVQQKTFAETCPQRQPSNTCARSTQASPAGDIDTMVASLTASPERHTEVGDFIYSRAEAPIRLTISGLRSWAYISVTGITRVTLQRRLYSFFKFIF
ncbi:hypothetical protein EJ06DRAFT_91322 [Trichodelitschia bisporula]|uniref:Uncharacterized protein n=1 Tax=Trichodelitschia bisporula TaxID=703511 RepID=A0A6G1HRZ2_9PEZI|nr:hypothetical protein EJ06DRAFT_91322 [Trichodelitschia bisporula]